MDDDHKVRFGVMEKSIEFIKENQIKMDHKLDKICNYIDDRFREHEEKLNKSIRDSESRGKDNFAGKYVERAFWLIIPPFLALSVTIISKVMF